MGQYTTITKQVLLSQHDLALQNIVQIGIYVPVFPIHIPVTFESLTRIMQKTLLLPRSMASKVNPEYSLLHNFVMVIEHDYSLKMN